MSPRIQTIPIASEQTLEQLIMAEPQNLEDTLVVLDNQVAAGSGFIDILAVDSSDNSLVIIELKKEESDRVLVQALQYYDFVRENIERFATSYSSKHEIDVLSEPRLIIVAHSFSDALSAAAKYINPSVSLYQYEYLSLGNQKGLYLTEVPISNPREFTRRRKSPQEHLQKIVDDKLRKICQTFMDKIMGLGSEHITVKGLRSRVSLKYDGNNLVDIRTRQNYFYISYRGHWQERLRVEKEQDLNDSILEQIKSAMCSIVDGSMDGEIEPEDENS